MPQFMALVSKLNCFDRHQGGWESLPSTGEHDCPALSSRGQDVLALLMQQDVEKSGNPGDDVDWVAIVEKANQYQRKEEALRMKQERNFSRLKLLDLKRSLERRMQDGKGSFSANMVTYSMESSAIPLKSYVTSTGNRPRRISNTGQIFFGGTTIDDRSRCSTSTRSVQTMHVIDEELEFI